MKHKFTLNIVDRSGKTLTEMRGASLRLPARLLRLLFGGYTQVYLLAPGQTLASVDIVEVKEGEEQHG